MTNKHQIIVEGLNDQRIFEKLLQDIGITNIDVLPPSKVEKGGNGVDNLIKILPNTIRKLQERGENGNRLAIIVDADYFDDVNNKEGGFERRRDEICKIISECDYITPDTSPLNRMKGELFSYKDAEMPPIGLWIMPNHQNDGMMEDLIINCINHTNGVANVLKNHANPAIEKLISDSEIASHLFDKDKHLNKIKIETWEKWQNGLVFKKDDILDMNHQYIKDLKDWLIRVFVN